MLSKETTMGLALIVMSQAILAECMEQMDNGNMVGIMSQKTPYDASPQQLHFFYGKDIYEMSSGFSADTSLAEFLTHNNLDSGYHDLQGVEYFRACTVNGGIDYPYWNGDSGTSPSEWAEILEDSIDYTEEFDNLEGLLVSQIAQVIDWDEVWADKDFFTESNKVFLFDHGNTDGLRKHPHRIFHLDKALAYHSLPSVKELITPLPKEEWNVDMFQISRDFLNEYNKLKASELAHIVSSFPYIDAG